MATTEEIAKEEVDGYILNWLVYELRHVQLLWRCRALRKLCLLMTTPIGSDIFGEGLYRSCFLSLGLLLKFDCDSLALVTEDKVVCISVTQASSTGVPALTTARSLLIALYVISLSS